MIRVAIADDSPFTCNLLASYIEAGGSSSPARMYSSSAPKAHASPRSRCAMAERASTIATAPRHSASVGSRTR